MEFFYGLMLLTNRGVLLALIREMPTTVTIFWLNTYIVATPRQLFTGPQELFMNGMLLLAYSGYMAAVFRLKLEPMWLWNGRKRSFRSEPNSSTAKRALSSPHQGDA
ncbi:hypothetical protein [Paraburkholderia sp. MM5477-R1]|uniref:hypothetical protein n=1 Tax=Paraburkholderia sp. MM5477-R1 TaxID=2991062 RepID=UPI003D1E6376